MNYFMDITWTYDSMEEMTAGLGETYGDYTLYTLTHPGKYHFSQETGHRISDDGLMRFYYTFKAWED